MAPRPPASVQVPIPPGVADGAAAKLLMRTLQSCARQYRFGEPEELCGWLRLPIVAGAVESTVVHLGHNDGVVRGFHATSEQGFHGILRAGQLLPMYSLEQGNANGPCYFIGWEQGTTRRSRWHESDSWHAERLLNKLRHSSKHRSAVALEVIALGTCQKVSYGGVEREVELLAQGPWVLHYPTDAHSRWSARSSSLQLSALLLDLRWED